MSELTDRVDGISERARARHAAERVARAAEAEVRKANVEQRRVELREAMPDVARVVDLFRNHGVGVTVLAAAENGRVVINRRGCDRMCVDVDEYEKG